MSIQLATPAPCLPVGIVTALRHIRALESDADLVSLYLQAATDAVEDYTGRALITKTYNLFLDSWPNYRSFWPTFRSYVPSEVHPLWSTFNLRAIELRRTPLVTINSLLYWDATLLTQQTIDPSNYATDTSSTPGKLVFVENGFSLPDVMQRFDAVTINFTSGYGTTESAVPAMMRMAVLMFAHAMFDNRMPVGDAKMVPLPYSLKHMLDAYRVPSLTQVK